MSAKHAKKGTSKSSPARAAAAPTLGSTAASADAGAPNISSADAAAMIAGGPAAMVAGAPAAMVAGAPVAMVAGAPVAATPSWLDSADPRKRRWGKIIFAGIWIYVGALWLLALDQTFHWGIFGPKVPLVP